MKRLRSSWTLRWAKLAVFLLVSARGSHCAWSGTIRADVEDAKYLQLAQSDDYDAVGRVSWFQTDGGYTATSVLIRPDWVLTAAHVVEGTDRQGAGIENMTVTLQGVRYDADRWIANPDWNTFGGSLGQGVDIGLIHLEQPAYNVASAVLYAGTSERTKLGTIVGYGTTGTGITGADQSAGTLRAGQNVIDVVQRDNRRGTPILSIDFDNPKTTSDSRYGSRTPVELEYLPAPGDSGGPIYIDVNGIQQVAGIVSFVSSIDQETDSDYGDTASFTRVSAYLPWIESVVGTIQGKIMGDIDGDRRITVADMDALTLAVSAQQLDSVYDLNQDSIVDDSDRIYWIEKVHATQIGDANLDGAFNTSDFVSTLQAGQYDDALAGNSSWSTGDWDGDGEFSSSDLIYALTHSEFEGAAPAMAERDASRQIASLKQVPEPSSSVFLLVIAFAFA